MNRVKDNIEEDFNIKIISGYFSYIFTNYSKDDKVISFCKEFKIFYLDFSFEEMKFNSEIPFNLDDCFITDKFPFHNYFSILPENKFEYGNELDINNYKEIIKYKKLFTFIPIKIDIINQLKWLFKIRNKSNLFNPNNDYAVFGFFDEMKDFSKKFCIWYNVNEKKIYYYEDENIKTISKEFDFSDINSEKKEWILICSKYKYKYLTDKDIELFAHKLESIMMEDLTNNK